MAEDSRPKRLAAAAGNPGHGKQGNTSGHHAGRDHSPVGAVSPVLEEIRTILWKDVGIIRNGRDLSLAVEELGALEVERPAKASRQECELHNLWTLAQLIARSALAREESRGSHYRSDFPFCNDEDFKKHSILARGKKVSFE